MASLNRIELIGNVGKDPEIRTFDNGDKVASLSLATSERYKDRKGELREVTEWHNITVFGSQADNVERIIVKGTLLFVEGRLRSREYEDREGVTRKAVEVVCNRFVVLSGGKPKPQDGYQPVQRQKGRAPSTEIETFDGSDENDDLPF